MTHRSREPTARGALENTHAGHLEAKRRDVCCLKGFRTSDDSGRSPRLACVSRGGYARLAYRQPPRRPRVARARR
jgi:hypothetical protein